MRTKPSRARTPRRASLRHSPGGNDMRAFVQRSLAFTFVRLRGRAFGSSARPSRLRSPPMRPPQRSSPRRSPSAGREDAGRVSAGARAGARRDLQGATTRPMRATTPTSGVGSEQPTGSRMPQTRVPVQRRKQQRTPTRRATSSIRCSRRAGNFMTNLGAAAQARRSSRTSAPAWRRRDGQTGEADALAKFEEEWNRLLSEDRAAVPGRRRSTPSSRTSTTQARGATRRAGGAGAHGRARRRCRASASQPSARRHCEATHADRILSSATTWRACSGTVSIATCPAANDGRASRSSRASGTTPARSSRSSSTRRGSAPTRKTTRFTYRLPDRRERRAHERARARLDVHLRRSRAIAYR